MMEHAIARLVQKRAELGGLIAKLERQLVQLRADLAHIDGVLRILASEIDPEAIRPKRRYRRTRYFARNELRRLCLDILRTAGEPLSVDALARSVIAEKGFETGDARLRPAIADQVGSVMKQLASRSLASSVGRGRGARWQLTDQPE